MRNGQLLVANGSIMYRTRYRELVGTAETIVSMNREMQEVDSTLGDIGRRCNPRLMEKKYTHYNQITENADNKGMLMLEFEDDEVSHG